MEITYQKLDCINFPIYGLPSADVEVADGLLRDGGFVIDDRNQIGGTLGARRLQTPHQLLPLKKMYEDIAGMLQANTRVFVDSQGYCFIYRKTKFEKVIYYKIKKVVPRETYSLLTLYRVPFPIRVKRPPPEGMSWVGMLHRGKHPWIPYEYSNTRCEPKRKKI